MRALSMLLVLSHLACGASFHAVRDPGILVQESFSESSFRHEWLIETPNVTRATVRLQNGALVLAMPAESSGEITLRRKLDVLTMRGKRIRIKARVRTEGPMTSSARAT